MLKKKEKALLVAGAAVVVLYLGWVVWVFQWTPEQLNDHFRPKESVAFSKAAWLKTKFGNLTRYEMANDLVRSRRLIGATAESVRDLLGPPLYEDSAEGSTCLHYDLVHQRAAPAKCLLLPRFLFWNIDTWALDVQCRDGRVTFVKIRET